MHRQSEKVLRSSTVLPCHDTLEETGDHDVCTCRQVVHTCQILEEGFALKTVPGLPTCFTTLEGTRRCSAGRRDDPLMALELLVDNLEQGTSLVTNLPAKEIAGGESQLTSDLVLHLHNLQQVFFLRLSHALSQKMCRGIFAESVCIQRHRCFSETSQCC